MNTLKLKTVSLDHASAFGLASESKLSVAKEIYAWLMEGDSVVERHSAAKALIPLTSAEAPRKRGRPKKATPKRPYAHNAQENGSAAKRKYTKRNAEYWK